MTIRQPAASVDMVDIAEDSNLPHRRVADDDRPHPGHATLIRGIDPLSRPLANDFQSLPESPWHIRAHHHLAQISPRRQRAARVNQADQTVLRIYISK
ncbi:hypothetical protein D3C80_1940180 [compost metagenome]